MGDIENNYRLNSGSIGRIVAIKPFHIKLISFEITDDPDLLSRIPRSTHIGDHKVTTDPNNPYINREKLEEPEPTTTHTILEEPSFTNAPHGEIKIRDTDGYEELVKKYLQVGQLHKVYGNTLHTRAGALHYKLLTILNKKEEIDMEAVSHLQK
ncbi:45943_t:CDS:2, partial [Gigaspora margarita]